MSRPAISHTWDGKPISDDPLYGASVIVSRLVDMNHEFLILHRSANGSEYEGDWAWTPPSGTRHPDESVYQCALRELHEETGLRLSLRPIDSTNGDWVAFVAEVDPNQPIRLCAEHDRFDWVNLEEAIARCRPEAAAQPFAAVGQLLGL